jgi:signal transduction histidine kinase
MNIDEQWLGRLVRVLLVFRSLVLLITIATLPSQQRTPAVELAVVVAAAVTYVPLRRWDEVAESLSRHPAYLAFEVLLATLILAAAGARSPFFYYTLGTGALAGVIYGRRGAVPFSALLAAGYELVAREGYPHLQPLHGVQNLVFAPLLYPVAIVAGIAAREVVARGIETETLLRDRTEALAAEQERMRVARELHDSLAKTVEGLAMTASVLPRRCERDPAAAAELARELVVDARRAALEARALMSDLRAGDDAQLPLVQAIRGRAQILAQRSDAEIEVRAQGQLPELEPAHKHELLRIVGEAMINAVRHGGAAHVLVSVGSHGGETRLAIADDGCGLDGPVDFDWLKREGHFGLAGMNERARALGARLAIRPGKSCGTVVMVALPSVTRAAPATTPFAGIVRRFAEQLLPAPVNSTEEAS